MWQLTSDKASLQTPQLSLEIDLARSDHAIALRSSDGQSLATLWGLAQLRDLPLLECYLRDNDLVACYAPGREFPFHTDVYWSIVELPIQPQPQLALSLLVSVRTDLLDTHPEIELHSTAPPESLEAIPTDQGVIYTGPLSPTTTLIDFAEDQDCASEELGVGEGHRDLLRRELFAHFLEKGVIRRARLFAALDSAPTPAERAAKLCEAFLATGMPLTT